MKKRNREKKNLFYYIPLIIVLVVLVLNVGYSAFQNTGIITDITTTVRPETFIRITGVTVDSTSNATVSSVDYASVGRTNEYNSSILSGVTFTRSTSSVTYKVEVTNFGNTEMGVSSISGLPNNLEYELDTNNYNIGERICNSSNLCTGGIKKDIYVTIKYKSGSGTNTTTNLNANFNLNFKEMHKVYYGGVAIDYIIDGGTKTVGLGNNPPTYVKVTGTHTGHSYVSPNVTINDATSDIYITEVHKVYVDSIEQQDTVDHGGNITVNLGNNAPANSSDITITGTYGSSSYNNPNLTLNNVTTDIHITISSGSGGGSGTWTEPVEDHTVTVYDPDNMTIPPSSTIKYEEVTGQPQISTDSSGNITRFEYTDIDETNGINLPSGGVDTGILAFDGHDFTATLTATLSFASCTKNICPILGAATKTTSVNGALIYEMRVASSGYGHNASGTNQSPPYNKFRFGRYENSNATGSDDFNINSRVTSSTSSGRYGYNSSTSSVKLTFKLYYTNGVFSSEIYDSSGNILAKPHNNLTITFSNTSGSAFNDITVEVGHFQHNTEYTHTFTIHDFKVVKS